MSDETKILSEAELRKEIKTQIMKEVVKNNLNKIVQEAFSDWLASKIPGTSSANMSAALSKLAQEEVFDNLDIQAFIQSAQRDLSDKFIPQLSQMIAKAINKSTSSIAKQLEKSI